MAVSDTSSGSYWTGSSMGQKCGGRKITKGHARKLKSHKDFNVIHSCRRFTKQT